MTWSPHRVGIVPLAVVLVVGGCGSAAAPGAEKRAAEPVPITTVVPVEPGAAAEEDAGVEPEPSPPREEPERGAEPGPHQAGGTSITNSSSGGGSCGEEAERECQMRGGNCSLVADSPCVGRGTRCQDWEMEMSSGCRCYCEPTDAAGRPVLPR